MEEIPSRAEGMKTCDPPPGLQFKNLMPLFSSSSGNCGECSGYELKFPSHVENDPVATTSPMPENQHNLTRKIQSKHRFHATNTRNKVLKWTSTKLQEKKLRNAASAGNTEEINDLINHLGLDLNAADAKQRTALHFSAAKGADDIVQVLLQNGAHPNVKDLNGNTPLHLAACTNHIRVITLLLHYGADASVTDHSGKTPLHLALSRLRIFQNKESRQTEYALLKRKADVGEIVAMLKEYMKQKGSDNEKSELNEIGSRLSDITTTNEVSLMR